MEAFRQKTIDWINRHTVTAAVLAAAVFVLAVAGLFQLLETYYQTAYATVTWSAPGQLRQELVKKGRAVTLRPGPEQEGFTFLGWQTEDRLLLLGDSLPVEGDMTLTARYAAALGSRHVPYLTAEGNCFRPREPLTWAETVDMISALADVSFTLGTQDLDAPITYGELLRILSAFVPQESAYTELSLLDMAVARGWLAPREAEQHTPEDPVLRQVAAVILNRVLNRHPEPDTAQGLAPGHLVDVPESSPYYGDILEALVPHQFEPGETGGERWTGCTPLPALTEGPLFCQGRLHWVLSDGSPARSQAVGALLFDEEGNVTTGSGELDKLVFEQFRQLLGKTPERSLESLKVLYDYSRRSFEYRRRNYYAPGETGWENAEALTMLREGSGNCYNYTAVFCLLSRFLGYDTQAVSGQVFQKRDEEAEDAILPMTPHAWCEIEIDGELRIFDPEYEYRYRGSDGKTFFNASDDIRGQFGYEK